MMFIAFVAGFVFGLVSSLFIDGLMGFRSFHRFAAYFLRWDYVILETCKSTMIRRAQKIAGEWYAAPYLPETRCRLLPKGEVRGQSYVYSWRPITKRMFQHYDYSARVFQMTKVKKEEGAKY